MEVKQTMWSELIGKIDEMYGATLLAVIGGTAMYLKVDGGIVDACVTGIVALLVTKAVRSNST
jgi:hypothetical protein